jgi:hypothetical protein
VRKHAATAEGEARENAAAAVAAERKKAADALAAADALKKARDEEAAAAAAAAVTDAEAREKGRELEARKQAAATKAAQPNDDQAALCYSFVQQTAVADFVNFTFLAVHFQRIEHRVEVQNNAEGSTRTRSVLVIMELEYALGSSQARLGRVRKHMIEIELSRCNTASKLTAIVEMQTRALVRELSREDLATYQQEFVSDFIALYGQRAFSVAPPTDWRGKTTSPCKVAVTVVTASVVPVKKRSLFERQAGGSRTSASVVEVSITLNYTLESDPPAKLAFAMHIGDCTETRKLDSCIKKELGKPVRIRQKRIEQVSAGAAEAAR